MPRKLPLSHAERAIGARVAEFRKRRLIPQTTLALALNISRAQLINYESGISPLPWPVAFRLFKRFQVNPRWLMTGKLPIELNRGTLDEPNPKEFSNRAPFSEIYPTLWKARVETETAMTAIEAGTLDLPAAAETWTGFIGDAARGWLQRLPNGTEEQFFLELTSEAERIIEKFKARSARTTLKKSP